jgi:rsbT co-antagonist protein RsbR
MQNIITKTFQMEKFDIDLQRRSLTAIIIAIVLFFGLLPSVFRQAIQAEGLQLVRIALTMIIFVLSFVAIRIGKVNIAISLLLVNLYHALIAPAVLVPGQETMAFFLSGYSVLIAGLTMKPRFIWIVLTACIVWIVYAATQLDATRITTLWEDMFAAIIFNIMIAIFSFLSSTSLYYCLTSLKQTQQELQDTHALLAHESAYLEQRVDERTNELAQAFKLAEQQAAKRQQLVQETERQRAVIRNLSVPQIPVDQDTLIIPLVGELDGDRLQIFQEQALIAIEQYRARILIIDITGVPLIDSVVATGIVNVVQATYLLGAQVFLVGISPEVAQTIVQLQLPLTSLKSYSSLNLALKDHLSDAGVQQASYQAA